jgi:hypothetical protein
MKITVDLADQLDVQAALAILAQYASQGVTSMVLPAPTAPPSAAAVAAQNFVDALWPHLGQSMRRLVKKAAELTTQQPMITIGTLAGALNRDEKSVRASMNGPLAIAMKGVKQTMATAPDLFNWQHNGVVYELGMSEEIRNAVNTKPVF